MRLALLTLLLVACAQPAIHQHPQWVTMQGGPTRYHFCEDTAGDLWECPNDFYTCGPRRGMCQNFGDPEGPGWGDIQQEGSGEQWSPER